MTTIPEAVQLQATRSRLELAKTFQDDMGAHFFEHTMYDVKDALTSILALCDMEDMKQMPQVKKYIQRVTELLQDVRLYHNANLFNVNHVLVNVINTLKKRYKAKIHITYQLAMIKAPISSDQRHLELVLLYLLIEAVESSKGDLKMEVELLQKERDAVITISLAGFEFSSVALKEIQEFHVRERFRLQIEKRAERTEVTLRLPIAFDIRDKEAAAAEKPHTIKLSKPRVVAMRGAQERT